MKDTMITLGYVDLAIAIVQQAAEDYRNEYRRYLRTRKVSSALLELEHFFNSDYGDLCTFEMAHDIVAELRYEVEQKYERYNGLGKLITYQGKTQALLDWARELGMNPQSLQRRFARGWSVEDAFTIPMTRRRCSNG